MISVREKFQELDKHDTMLSEHFVASLGALRKSQSTSVAKDAAIFDYEYQPLTTQRSVFKKSSTLPNCLAVSASHIFAAQADKAVVHVYNKEKGNQESTIPFPERIGCLALACNDTVLVLGAEKGRIILWETHTGRQVTTSQSHLQPVTALAVDHSSNLLLSGSADSSVHVWSLSSLLSFSASESSTQQTQNTPLRTLSAHREGITSIVLGHSSGFSNIAVSASKDNTCLVWDYQSGGLLQTILLPATPLCLAIDPADRAFYAGYEDGSVQIVDFYKPSIPSEEITGDQQPLLNAGAAPVQPDATTRWEPPQGDVIEATLSMIVSYDSSTLITGHDSGKIVTWDIPRSQYSTLLTPLPLPAPVTNLVSIPVTGFPESGTSRRKQHMLIKPRYGDFDNGMTDGQIPANYTMSTQFVSGIPNTNISATGAVSLDSQFDFEVALTHSAFPAGLLAASLGELSSWRQPSETIASTPKAAPVPDTEADFMLLDEPKSNGTDPALLKQQNAQLKKDLDALRRVQKASFKQMEALRAEKQDLLARIENGAQVDVEMKDLEEAEAQWTALGPAGKTKKKSSRAI